MIRPLALVSVLALMAGCQTTPVLEAILPASVTSRTPASAARAEWIQAKDRDAAVFEEIGANISRYAVRADTRDLRQTIHKLAPFSIEN